MAEIDDVLDCILDIQGFAVISHLFCQAFSLLWFNAHSVCIFQPQDFFSSCLAELGLLAGKMQGGPWLGLLCVAVCGLECGGTPG